MLGPVLARLLQAHEAQHGDGRALLLSLDNQAQLAHVVAYLPDASRTPRVLLVPALQPDAALLAGLRQQGCALALRDIAAPPRPSWRPAGLSATGCQMTRSTASCCIRWPGDWGWCSCRCWRAVRQGSWPEHKERY